MNKLCYYDENNNMDNNNCGAVCKGHENDMMNNVSVGAECYSPTSEKYVDCILEFIYEEYSDYQLYKRLARECCRPNLRSMFMEMAKDELCHTNTFVSAYFLITGKRFCPTVDSCCNSADDICDIAQFLRQRYFEELCGSQKYAKYAEGVDDKCLKDLLIEASEDEKGHSRMLLDAIRDLCVCK